jgi:hypothetical protein
MVGTHRKIDVAIVSRIEGKSLGVQLLSAIGFPAERMAKIDLARQSHLPLVPIKDRKSARKAPCIQPGCTS